MGAGSLLATLCLALRPPQSGPVAALFPPWWSAARSVSAAAAAGAVVRFGAVGFVVAIVPDVPTPGRQLRQAGAWLTSDPRALGACSDT